MEISYDLVIFLRSLRDWYWNQYMVRILIVVIQPSV